MTQSVFFLLALECQPDYFEAHNGLGIIYREMGRLEQARAVFTAALENHPESADLYANLANVFKDMGLIHLAVTHLMQALLIRPQDYDLRSSLIMTLGYHYHGIDPMVYVSEAKFFAELAQNVNQYTSYSADVNKERKTNDWFCFW
ncbi:tetratricopeptide repeat protein [Deefgea sp. CFH1-16]|uniref:tetratricopeptide repeat protein n=1 Tax=Deefgea sp. CFH1-16 TaxID=2675457 RepID=UPI0015F5703F|nr:tetratricopeptide repeat protein [Deefgea sp. CFH1-16]MBM5575405.1 tetratricopeptide repeat protein [Deefgea sp. CFH1-16]